MSDYHTAVLATEVIEGLHIIPGKKYIDATLGGGGHSREIIKRGGILLGIDTDAEAIKEAEKELRTQDSMTNWKLVQGNFRDIVSIAKENGFEHVDGILFDLGVSSHQLDTVSRGFSYRFGTAPLDLRLNQNMGMTAAEYIKTATEEDLYETIGTYGEEERARAIARAIISARQVSPIETTGELLKVIEGVVGESQGKTVASRVFQALRIVVNDEFGALKSGLKGAEELLAPGGRLVVISFHSLEDRIVKQFLRSNAWKQVTKKPIVANDTEIYLNKRARSAKLRIAEKI